MDRGQILDEVPQAVQIRLLLGAVAAPIDICSRLQFDQIGVDEIGVVDKCLFLFCFLLKNTTLTPPNSKTDFQ